MVMEGEKEKNGDSARDLKLFLCSNGNPRSKMVFLFPCYVEKERPHPLLEQQSSLTTDSGRRKGIEWLKGG